MMQRAEAVELEFRDVELLSRGLEALQIKAAVYAQLEEHMSKQGGQIGAVHLAMQPAMESLIFQWSHATEAVVDPGMALLERLRLRCCHGLPLSVPVSVLIV